MNPEVYRALYPNGWQTSQHAAVEAALAEQDVWVAEKDDVPVGVVSIFLHHEDSTG